MTGPGSADDDSHRDTATSADEVLDHDVEPPLTIRAASSLLGVPAPTLRSWERRYGVPLTDRSDGGHRRYSPSQLDELRQMRDLIERGRRPAEAAALIAAGHSTSPEPLVEAFLDATRALTPGAIARTLDTARETLGLDRTIDEVLLPAMREVGESWHGGRLDLAHEHLATHATQAWLATVSPNVTPRPQPPIILSCGPLDHHTLGLEAIAALLRHRFWDCRLLGARTPAESLAHAVVETDAIAVVLVCHISGNRKAAVAALRTPELERRHVFYAGGAFEPPRARNGVPGQYLGTHLSRAADLITATLTPPSSG